MFNHHRYHIKKLVKMIHDENRLEFRFAENGGADPYSYDALKNLHKAAENGDLKSQRKLAFLYLDGTRIVPIDYSAALFWYKKAADNGCTLSQHLVGDFYSLGPKLGKNSKIEVNDELAKKYYELSANSLYPASIYELFLISDRSNPSEDQMIYNFNTLIKLATNEYCDAQFSLGYLYRNGRGTDINYQSAVQWNLIAYLKGHLAADYIMSNFLKEGIVIRKDIVSACAWSIFSKIVEMDFSPIRDEKHESEIDEILISYVDQEYNHMLSNDEIYEAIQITKSFHRIKVVPKNDYSNLKKLVSNFHEASRQASILAKLGFTPTIHNEGNDWILCFFDYAKCDNNLRALIERPN